TIGHEDSLIIGRIYSKMAGLSERQIVRSAMLAKPDPIIPRERIVGVTERVDRDGDVIVPLDEGSVNRAIAELLGAGVEAIAVSLLWSFANNTHERRIKDLVREQTRDVFVSVSHEVAPMLGEYERTATTAVNAYIGPVVTGYLRKLESGLAREGLRTPL